MLKAKRSEHRGLRQSNYRRLDGVLAYWLAGMGLLLVSCVTASPETSPNDGGRTTSRRVGDGARSSDGRGAPTPVGESGRDAGDGGPANCPASDGSAPLNSCHGGEPACFGCFEGAGFTCYCQSEDSGSPGDASNHWQCVGTEHACP